MIPPLEPVAAQEGDPVTLTATQTKATRAAQKAVK